MASPATPLASALAETFRDEEDQVRAQQLFELNAYRSNVDTQEYRKIAQLIAELALAGKGQSESQRDIEMAALRLAGLANGSISLLGESQQKEVDVACPSCHQRMRAKGGKPKWIKTQSGTVRVKRAYYYCEDCEIGHFPPR